MTEPTGYRLRAKGSKTAVCSDCAVAIDLDTSSREKLDTRQFASELCVVCGEDITEGNGGSFNYPEEIAVLLDVHFEDAGERFGGVIPLIDSDATMEEVAPGVKKSTPQPTQYDPVVVNLQPHEKGIVDQLQEFADTVSKLGPLRGKKEEFTDDETGETLGYRFTFFAAA